MPSPAGSELRFPKGAGLCGAMHESFAAVLCASFAAMIAAAPTTQAVLEARAPLPGTMWLEQIGLEKSSQRRGQPRAGRTLRDQPIVLGGVEYARGIGTRSISELVVDLPGSAAHRHPLSF